MTFFCMFRDTDTTYPLSEGFYENDSLTNIFDNHYAYFYHPDEDCMQRYLIDTILSGWVNGYKFVIALSNVPENCRSDALDYVKDAIFDECAKKL